MYRMCVSVGLALGCQPAFGDINAAAFQFWTASCLQTMYTKVIIATEAQWRFVSRHRFHHLSRQGVRIVHRPVDIKLRHSVKRGLFINYL
jgi:hypothetical protein